MNKLVSVTAVFGILLIAISPARAAPIYTTADFSGGVSTVTSLGNSMGFEKTSACSGCAAGSVGGHVLFDKNLMRAQAALVSLILRLHRSPVPRTTIFSILYWEANRWDLNLVI